MASSKCTVGILKQMRLQKCNAKQTIRQQNYNELVDDWGEELRSRNINYKNFSEERKYFTVYLLIRSIIRCHVYTVFSE